MGIANYSEAKCIISIDNKVNISMCLSKLKVPIWASAMNGSLKHYVNSPDITTPLFTLHFMISYIIDIRI